MHLTHRILLFSLIFFITACAHDPKQVEASRPLVTAINSSYSLIPEDLQAPYVVCVVGPGYWGYECSEGCQEQRPLKSFITPP